MLEIITESLRLGLEFQVNGQDMSETLEIM